MLLAREVVLGGLIGYFGGRLVVLVLNRLDLPQGLHAPFVATAAVVIFAPRPVGARLRASLRSISPASWSATARPARTTRW